MEPAATPRRHAATPPGPRLPAPAQSAWLAHDPVGFLERCRRRFGDVFALRLVPVGRVVVVGSPPLVHEILTGDAARYRAGAATARLLPFLGDRSPLLLDGDDHRTQRRRLLGAFSPHGAAGDRPAIEAIVRRHVERWPRGRCFATLPATRALAFEVVVRHAVGLDDIDLGALEQRLQRLLAGPARLALWAPRLAPPARRLDPRTVLDRRLADLDAALAAAIARRRPRAGDAVAALLGGDEPVPGREVTHVVRALVLVGHETTGTAASWLLQLLARHSAAAAALRDAGASDDRPLLRSAVEEALRVHPPVVDAVRELAVETQLGGFTIPAGTIVMAAPLLVHTRRDRYDDPYAFRADRFVGRRPDPAAWMPFGGGVRRCLGATLAQETLQALTRTVLERDRLTPGGIDPERARLSGTTLVPHRGGRIVLVPRGRRAEAAQHPARTRVRPSAPRTGGSATAPAEGCR
jgi:cytochrome P450